MSNRVVITATLATMLAAATGVQAQDLAAGEAAFQVCKTCHGQNGEGQQALNAPQLAGLPTWYLERQLNNYKSGIRGADPKDVYGAQMRPMSMTLANEQAVKNVSAYIASLPVTQPANTVGGDVAKGQAAYRVCATCHGQNAEGNAALNAPRLSALNDWYMVRQLQNYKSGIRGKHPQDTYGKQMAPMSMTLANDQAIKDVVSYIITLK